MNDQFIPLRINREKQRAMFKQYLVAWTPTIMLLDMDGKVHHRFNGFLTPPEMGARILLDAAKIELFLQRNDRARRQLDNIFTDYQGTFAIPEAIFYSGVVDMELQEDPKFLRQLLERLRKEFPLSEWTMKAKPYELIDL